MEYLIYLTPLILYLLWHLARGRAQARDRAQESAATAGPPATATRRPQINTTKCIGCGACIGACPEQRRHPVLGLEQGRVVLLNPARCVGDGGCAVACPVRAITLQPA